MNKLQALKELLKDKENGEKVDSEWIKALQLIQD